MDRALNAGIVAAFACAAVETILNGADRRAAPRFPETPVMNVNVVTHHGYLQRPSRNAIARRVEKAFAGHAAGVASVKIHLKDINGAPGSSDKACTVRAELVGCGHIIVTEKGTTARGALRRCIERTRSVVAEELKRRPPPTAAKSNDHRRQGTPLTPSAVCTEASA